MSDPNQSQFQETLPPPPREPAPPTVVEVLPGDSQVHQANLETILPGAATGGREAPAPTSPPVTPRPSVIRLEPQLPGGPPGYALLKELGRGAMGVVYKARQTALGRLVALKMVLGGGHASQEELDRFRGEAAAIARLSHPAIVQIYEIGEHDGMPYFAMEYCPGGCLSAHTAGVPLHPERAAQLLVVLAEGMYHAHQQGIIHRDLKPGNVMVMRLDNSGGPIDGPSDLSQVLRGRGDLSGVGLKIADFGLARQMETQGHTRTGDLLGTPSYMAPEQAEAQLSAMGPPTDVWALGAILYDLLAGRPPFRGSTAMETVRMVIEQEPVPLRQFRTDVPRDLETICLKCLQKDRHQRYQSAKELADDLTRYLEGRPIHARPVSWVERGVRWARRRPVPAALAALLLVTVWGAILGWARFTVALREQRNRATQNEQIALANFRLAEERFLQAMGVVDRYFTEVSESTLLHEAGMAPLRRALLRNAQDFYVQFIQARDADEKLQREIVRSKYRLGLIEADLGNLQVAVQGFDAALERLQRGPQEADALQDRALILHHRGRVLRLQNKLDLAEASYEEALTAWRELEKGDDRPEYRHGEAGTLLGLGNVAYQRKNYARARDLYTEALDRRRKLAASAPTNEGYQRDLATAWQNLATVQGVLKDAKGAAASRAEALKTQQQLVQAFPGRPKYRDDLGMSWFNRGLAELQAGQFADGVTSCQKAIEQFASLAQAHPEEPGYRGRLADAYGNQAFGYERTNRAEDGWKTRLQAIEVRRSLVKDFPGIPAHQLGLVRGLQQVGEALQLRGKPGEALPWFEEMARVATGMRADKRLEKEGGQFFQEALRRRAQVLDEAGRLAEALAQWDELIKLQTGSTKALNEAQRLVTLAGTANYADAVARAEKAVAGATSTTRYELARVHARAALQVRKDPRLSQEERRQAELARRQSALALLEQLAKEKEFVPDVVRRRLLGDRYFVELRSSTEWQRLLTVK